MCLQRLKEQKGEKEFQQRYRESISFNRIFIQMEFLLNLMQILNTKQPYFASERIEIRRNIKVKIKLLNAQGTKLRNRKIYKKAYYMAVASCQILLADKVEKMMY